MPLANVNGPSVAMGTLKADLDVHGIGARVYYPSCWFADTLGRETLWTLQHAPPTWRVPEWLFAEAMWGPDPARHVWHWQTCASNGGAPDAATRVRLRDARRRVEEFLVRCVETIPWAALKIVGFTVSSHQRLAVMALARELKRRYRALHVVLGGPACHGPAGPALLRAFPFVDAVCVGDGERVFAVHIRGILGEQPPGPVPNFCRQGETAPPSVTTWRDLDALPDPDYDAYVERPPAEIPKERRVLFMEMARGCWWGERQPCTFCGHNGACMSFRQKSCDRTYAELGRLRRRYGHFTQMVHFTDSILPSAAFDQLLPRLAEKPLAIRLGAQTRSTLTRDQVHLCRRAGIVRLTLGVESLSTRLLQLMGKGVSAIRNIQTLKWCRQHGIRVDWNILLGIPGERADDYRRLPELARTLVHLEPPLSVHRVVFVRWSEYVRSPERYALRNLRPHPTYRSCYPEVDEQLLFDVVEEFTCDFEGQDEIENYAADVRIAAEDWRSVQERSALFSVPDGDTLNVVDLRGQTRRLVPLRGLERKIYEACDAARSANSLVASAGGDAEAVQAALDWLTEAGLLLSMDSRYLSLAIPLGHDYFPPPGVWSRLPGLLPGFS